MFWPLPKGGRDRVENYYLLDLSTENILKVNFVMSYSWIFSQHKLLMLVPDVSEAPFDFFFIKTIDYDERKLKKKIYTL